MRPILFIFVLLYSCTTTTSKQTASVATQDVDTRPVEQQIVDHLIPLEDNNTFPFLDEVVKGKRLIILGEAGHRDAVTFQTKINIIRQLKKKYGFDVLALEGISGVNSYLFNEFQQDTSFKDLQNSWAPVWGYADECRPVLEMLHERQIEYWGIEGVYATGIPVRENSLKCIKAILDKYRLENAEAQAIMRDESAEIWQKWVTAWPFSMPDTSVMLEFMHKLNNLKNYVGMLLRTKEYRNNRDLLFVLEIIKNIKSVIRDFHIYALYEKPFESNEAILRLNTERDATMARNLIWYMKQHPKKKVVLWCANFHGARDITQTIYPSDSTHYMRFQLLGGYLSDEFGDKMYSLAFTSGKGEMGLLEQAIGKRNLDFGFIDFTSIREFPEFFNRPFESSVIGKKTGNFMYIWDGFYYIKKENLSTLRMN